MLCTNVLSHSSKNTPNSEKFEQAKCSIIRGLNL